MRLISVNHLDRFGFKKKIVLEILYYSSKINISVVLTAFFLYYKNILRQTLLKCLKLIDGQIGFCLVYFNKHGTLNHCSSDINTK